MQAQHIAAEVQRHQRRHDGDHGAGQQQCQALLLHRGKSRGAGQQADHRAERGQAELGKRPLRSRRQGADFRVARVVPTDHQRGDQHPATDAQFHGDHPDMGRQQPQQRAQHHAQGVHGDVALVVVLANPPQALGHRFDAGSTACQGNHVAPTQHRVGQQRQLVALAGDGIDEAAQAPGAFQAAFRLMDGLAGELR
ncbi:hypothetical protein D3C87_1482330 [compost metagenome]